MSEIANPGDDPPVLFPENDYVPQDITVFDDASDRSIDSFRATAQVVNGTHTSGYRSFNGFRCFGIKNGKLWDRWAGNTSWSGSPKRTWYFRTNTRGRSEYNQKFLAPEYTSDPLYVNSAGQAQIPIGTVTITEIENPLGYLVVPFPLKCSVVQVGNIAEVEWDEASLNYIHDALNVNFHIIEEIDTTLFGSLELEKIDADTGTAPQGDATLNGAKYEVINHSENPVMIDGRKYMPGEICFEFTTDEHGHFKSDKIFPLGQYVVREAVPPLGYTLATSSTVHEALPSSAPENNLLKAAHALIETADARMSGKWVHDSKGWWYQFEDGSTWQPVSYSDAGITKGGCTSPNLVDGCLVSGADGLVVFEGLYPSIQYRLTEVEAPDGYVLLTKPAFEGLLPVENLTVTLTVHNSPGFTFPTTGTNSMQRMVLIGTLITLISGAMLVYPIRKRHT